MTLCIVFISIVVGALLRGLGLIIYSLLKPTHNKCLKKFQAELRRNQLIFFLNNEQKLIEFERDEIIKEALDRYRRIFR